MLKCLNEIDIELDIIEFFFTIGFQCHLLKLAEYDAKVMVYHFESILSEGIAVPNCRCHLSSNDNSLVPGTAEMHLPCSIRLACVHIEWRGHTKCDIETTRWCTGVPY